MTYVEWLAHYDLLTPKGRADLEQEILKLDHRPLISVLLPVYNGDLTFLNEAVASVQRQVYEHWEICVADDASTNRQIRPFLENLSRSDRRIKVLFRERNGHISACSNSALSLACGEWCGLLDQDDLLSENALALVAAEIASHPDAGLIYSDEDFIDSLGERSNPFFKSDWNPALFYGQNYINHFGVYRTVLLRQVGGFREGYEGSQDYDLALRCIERLRPEQIRHIPRLLYHWRMVEGSLAHDPDAKSYAREAARSALNSHLRRRGIAARAEPCPENAESHRVIYVLPHPPPLVSMIASGENADWLTRTDYPALELIQSGPGAAAANAAAERAQGEVLVFLSDGMEVIESSWLREMVSQVVTPEVGAVGARIWSREGSLEDGGLVLGLAGIAAPAFRGFPRGHPGYFNRAWLQQNYSAVSAACMVVKKNVFLEARGFDERNLPFHFYDVDFCLRLRERGLQVVWTPYANLILHASGSRDEAQTERETVVMQERWGAQLLSDPFYNPNLSLKRGFELAFPPRL